LGSFRGGKESLNGPHPALSTKWRGKTEKHQMERENPEKIVIEFFKTGLLKTAAGSPLLAKNDCRLPLHLQKNGCGLPLHLVERAGVRNQRNLS